MKHKYITILLTLLTIGITRSSHAAALSDAVEPDTSQTAGIDTPDSHDLTFLKFTITSDDDIRLVKSLIDAYNHRPIRHGDTLFPSTCENKIVSTLLNARAQLVDIHTPDSDGDTPLIKAAQTGNIKEMTTLINASAQLNATNKKGITALMHAACWQNASIAEILLNAGADINTVDQYTCNAWHYACDIGNVNVIKLFMRTHNLTQLDTHPNRITGLTIAAANGNIGATELLLYAKANVNTQSHNNATALMNAIRNKQATVVKTLILAGADHTLADVTGQSPWTHATPELKSVITQALAEKKETYQLYRTLLSVRKKPHDKRPDIIKQIFFPTTSPTVRTTPQVLEDLVLDYMAPPFSARARMIYAKDRGIAISEHEIEPDPDLDPDSDELHESPDNPHMSGFAGFCATLGNLTSFLWR
jgi:ankyrin repeat protein